MSSAEASGLSSADDSFMMRQKILNDSIINDQLIKSKNIFASESKAWKLHKQDVKNRWSDEISSNEKNWLQHKSEIKKIWNELKVPGIKTYASYSSDLNTRIEINFETGKVVIDRLSSKTINFDEVKQEVTRIIANNMSLLEGQLSNDFSKEIVIKEGQLKGSDEILRNHYSTSFNLSSDHVKRRAIKYIPLVNELATKLSLPKELVMAIMWQESAFNPLARSHIPAYGLMQIVPKYAGNEVKDHLGEKNVIDGDFLYNPENNIRYGTNYLSLLSNKYFNNINPFMKRAPFIVAAYNWGPTRLLKRFQQGRFNLNNTESLISQIREIAPDETKDYLLKVFSKWRTIEDQKWL